MADTLRLAPSTEVPNSPLPVLVHRGALPREAGAARYEGLFARHGWTNAWRNALYPFHHYHSTSHEVLGVCGGEATLRLGGADGTDVTVAAGDVLVLPAGTGHCRIRATGNFSVVGSYPDGRDWDTIRAATASAADRLRAEAAIAAVPLPRRDPVTGAPLGDRWMAL